MSSIIKSQRIARETVISLGRTKMTKVVVEEEEKKVPEALCEKERQELLEQAKLEASQILAQARDEAQNMIEQAQCKVDQLRANTKEECSQLREQVEVKIASMQQEAKEESEAIIQQAYTQKDEILQEAEPEIISLVQQLVSHIIHEELVLHTKWLTLLLRKICHKEHIREPIQLSISLGLEKRLSPEEKEIISDLGEGVILRIDEALNDTTCEVKTSHGSIVYDVELGLEQVLKELSVLHKL